MANDAPGHDPEAEESGGLGSEAGLDSGQTPHLTRGSADASVDELPGRGADSLDDQTLEEGAGSGVPYADALDTGDPGAPDEALGRRDDVGGVKRGGGTGGGTLRDTGDRTSGADIKRGEGSASGGGP